MVVSFTRFAVPPDQRWGYTALSHLGEGVKEVPRGLGVLGAPKGVFTINACAVTARDARN